MSAAANIERKLQVIVSTDYGPSHHRCERRLQAMVPRLIAAGGTVPDFVREHVEKCGLDVDLGSGKPKPPPQKPKAAAEGDG